MAWWDRHGIREKLGGPCGSVGSSPINAGRRGWFGGGVCGPTRKQIEGGCHARRRFSRGLTRRRKRSKTTDSYGVWTRARVVSISRDTFAPTVIAANGDGEISTRVELREYSAPGTLPPPPRSPLRAVVCFREFRCT